MITFLMLLAAATPAAESLPKADSRLLMRDFANCMASRHNRDARAFLELDPLKPLTESNRHLVHSDCIPVVPPDSVLPIMGNSTPMLALEGRLTHYRYALAEALLLRTYRHSPPSVSRDAPPLSHPALAPGAPRPTDWTGDASTWPANVERSERDALASTFGECVVRSATDQSWALLRTEVESKAEVAAFTRLRPALAECLGKTHGMPAGKFAIRGTIALNFYRLAAESAVPSRMEEATK